MAREHGRVGDRRTIGGPSADQEAANWSNRTLFHGDNLGFLRAMNSASVDLIATDPPFNKGRDFHATPDSLAAGAKFQDRWSWKDDVQQDWVDQIKDDYPPLMEAIESAQRAHSDGMGAYMCFMAVRLLEMRRVLKPTGSIYLHCDPTASHYLKAVMDAIFGWKNFRNDVVWVRSAGFKRKTARRFPIKNETLLFYARDVKQIQFSTQYRPHKLEYVKRFKPDETGRLRRTDVNPTGGGRRTIYLDETPGDIVDSVWTDIPPVNPAAKERAGYPTQKPLALYERIIRASSNEGDMVLDPFAGCATTCVAAERLGRQWVGIDIWEKAHEVVIERLKGEGMLRGPDGGETATLAFGDIHYAQKEPERTDGSETAAPFLQVTEKRKRPPLEPWQKLSRAQIVQELTEAQSIAEGLVLCAGCGRELEAPFMELDHITPRSDRGENDISNRILLCRPCNGRKSAKLTMKGLLTENRKAGWLKDKERADHARDLAQERYEEVRYRRTWPAVTGDLFNQT